MSRTKVKSLPAWAAAVRRLRERLDVSQEGLARKLNLSISEIRRWDQGKRAPGTHRTALLARLAGPPDCWVFWEVAGITKEDVLHALEREGIPIPKRRKTRRWSEETQEAAFSALELIFERAPSAVIEQTLEFLVNRAGKYGDAE